VNDFAGFTGLLPAPPFGKYLRRSLIRLHWCHWLVFVVFVRFRDSEKFSEIPMR
jgi:hypothetical protein